MSKFLIFPLSSFNGNMLFFLFANEDNPGAVSVIFPQGDLLIIGAMS